MSRSEHIHPQALGRPQVPARPSRSRAVIAGTTAASLLLVGCVTTTERLRTTYVVAGDACTPQRERVIAANQDFSGELIQGAALGALAGGLITVLAGGSGRDVAIGAAVGALTGAAANYFNARLQRANNDRNAAYAAIGADAERDRARFGQFANDVSSLRQCREAQVALIAQRAREGRMPRAEALLELERQRGLHNGDTSLINEVFGRIDERSAVYIDATAQTLNANDRRQVLGAVADYRPTFTPVTSTLVVRQGTTASVRSDPNNESRVVARLPAGTQVNVTGTSGTWVRVSQDGREAYVARSLLEERRIEGPVRLVASAPPPRAANPQQALVLDQITTRAEDQARTSFVAELIESTRASVEQRSDLHGGPKLLAVSP